MNTSICRENKATHFLLTRNSEISIKKRKIFKKKKKSKEIAPGL